MLTLMDRQQSDWVRTAHEHVQSVCFRLFSVQCEPVCDQVYFWLYMCSASIMMNGKETTPSDCKVRSVVCFLTIENNSKGKMFCLHCLWRECNEPQKCSVMAVGVPRRGNKHTRQWAETVTKHDVRWNCVMCMPSSSSHYDQHTLRDGSTPFARCW